MKTPALADILLNRRWRRSNEPFPHVIVKDVFVPSVVAAIQTSVRQIKMRGLGSPGDPAKLTRNMSGYDAYGLSLNSETEYPLGLFLSQSWHDLLKGIFSIDATGHINCALHYHAPGSANGWIHNDLNPGWFGSPANDESPAPANPSECSYTHGSLDGAISPAIETVRALAMLYYIDNGSEWLESGGGTGLFKLADQSIENPDVVVPPVDNTLLAFECTPISYHAFLGPNPRPRTCIIMWLHRPRDTVAARWGLGSICGWPPRRVAVS